MTDKEIGFAIEEKKDALKDDTHWHIPKPKFDPTPSKSVRELGKGLSKLLGLFVSAIVVCLGVWCACWVIGSYFPKLQVTPPPTVAPTCEEKKSATAAPAPKKATAAKPVAKQAMLPVEKPAVVHQDPAGTGRMPVRHCWANGKEVSCNDGTESPLPNPPANMVQSPTASKPPDVPSIVVNTSSSSTAAAASGSSVAPVQQTNPASGVASSNVD